MRPKIEPPPRLASSNDGAPPVVPLKQRRVTLGHVPLQVMSPESPHDILESALADPAAPADDLVLPYWVEIWPAAVALGRTLIRRDLAGVDAIELGAGVGLVGLAAARAGARVLVTDHQETALHVAQRNATLNGLRIETAQLDWRDPPSLPPFDLVLGADVLYERECIAPLARLVARLVAPGGEAIIADPGRSYVNLFVEALGAGNLEVTRTHTHFYWDERVRSAVLIHARRRQPDATSPVRRRWLGVGLRHRGESANQRR